MYFIAIIVLVASLITAFPLYSRIGSRVQQQALSPKKEQSPLLQQNPQELDAQKKDIIKRLEVLLAHSIIDDAWFAAVDDLIFDLVLIDRTLSSEYLKKVHNKMTSAVAPADPLVPSSESMKRGSPPLAPGAKSTEMPSAVVAPSGAMKTGTPPPPPGQMQKGTPPAAPGAMKTGTPPPVPGAGSIKKGGTPPPPPGPMVKGKKPAGATTQQTSPSVPKGPDPLSVKESYGARQLEKRTNEEVVELFNKLLEALGSNADFWDAVKKEPTLTWKNKIDTVKKALSAPARNMQMNTAQMIEDWIVQVKADKVKQGLEKQAAAEKVEKKPEQEEFSEKELIAKIEALKKTTNPDDFKWLIEFQGAIKKLDKVNHEKAVGYESEFIKKFPGQRSFLPKNKPIEVKKELTAEEKMMADIDKILKEKEGIWAIKAKNPIQELYEMNPELGLEYQEKYLAATKEATGKNDKPFLQLKK